MSTRSPRQGTSEQHLLVSAASCGATHQSQQRAKAALILPKSSAVDDRCPRTRFRLVAWVLIVLIISVVVGIARGGRLHHLLDVETRAWWLLLIGFGMQIVATQLPSTRSSLAVGLLLLSYVFIVGMVAINRQAPGMWIAGIGILMNFTVIALNRGMPVLPAAVQIAGGAANPIMSGKHVLLDEATQLPFLGDLIPLPGTVISMGDVFLAIGLGVFIEEMTRRRPRLFRHGVHGEGGSAVEH